MNKATSLRSTKLVHRWFGLALVVALLAGGAVGLPDWAFWAVFALGAGAGIVLTVRHWLLRLRRRNRRPGRVAGGEAVAA